MQNDAMRILRVTILMALGPAANAASSLTEYEGRYEYRDGLSVYMVAKDGQLIAVIDQSKYRLRSDGADKFLNPAGDSIPFLRDASQQITAFQEYGETFARISSEVPALTRMLLEPRPAAADGSLIDYRYQPPPQLSDGIPVATAGPGTLPRKVAESLVSGVIDGTYPDVRSLLVFHRGRLLLEEYFYGFDRDRPHGMRSFTKSVISLLVGTAVDRRLLRADEAALPRLGFTTVQNPDSRKAGITISQMLSNQSGLACDEHDRSSPGSEVRLFETDDWVKAFFDLPMLNDPGTTARYCSGGFFAAGRVIERAAQKPLPDYANDVLFEPLGIPRSHWRWNFTLDRTQRNEFGQLYLTPRDMLKLGILIRDRGRWQEKQVVSSSWVESAISHRSQVDDSDYGLGIWHRFYNVPSAGGVRRVDTIMLSGNGGQKVYVVPEFDLIVVSTGSAYFVDSPINRMLVQTLLPAFMETKR
jgi:CubicO group peptidase (beta-lactamase class C family)